MPIVFGICAILTDTKWIPIRQQFNKNYTKLHQSIEVSSWLIKKFPYKMSKIFIVFGLFLSLQVFKLLSIKTIKIDLTVVKWPKTVFLVGQRSIWSHRSKLTDKHSEAIKSTDWRFFGWTSAPGNDLFV